MEIVEFFFMFIENSAMHALPHSAHVNSQKDHLSLTSKILELV